MMNRLAFSSKKDSVLEQKHLIKKQCKKLLCLRYCGLSISRRNVIYPDFSVGRNCDFAGCCAPGFETASAAVPRSLGQIEASKCFAA